ncbi:unnamed protein product [Paramecium sonneborni]|uniref:RING-type domain-containing protein n=1 Tax=Paramecium sonneborni TaxID=65129 RepID=A0A8S1QU71_9CILI|nr:unnamed protein product [Paramecium sonneborni]
MKLYDIIEIIKHTEQKGQELLVDALILGIEIGRRNISNINDIKGLVEQLKNLKLKIDSNLLTPYIRDDIYDRILNQQEYLIDVLQSFQNTFRKLSQQIVQCEHCQICNKYVDKNNRIKTIQMHCNHLFHKQCVLPILTCENEIFHTYKCPICETQTISDEIVNQLQENTQVQTSCCPTPSCKNVFLFQGQEIYRCSNCKKKYCLRCLSEQHEINKCQTRNKNIQFQLGDNYKECPACKQWTKTKSQLEGIINCSGCNKKICFGCEDSKCTFCEHKGLFSTLKNKIKSRLR